MSESAAGPGSRLPNGHPPQAENPTPSLRGPGAARTETEGATDPEPPLQVTGPPTQSAPDAQIPRLRDVCRRLRNCAAPALLASLGPNSRLQGPPEHRRDQSGGGKSNVEGAAPPSPTPTVNPRGRDCGSGAPTETVVQHPLALLSFLSFNIPPETENSRRLTACRLQ